MVARYWRNLAIAATEKEQIWYSDQPRGVVFDFAKLRQFLADTVTKAGGKCGWGTAFGVTSKLVMVWRLPCGDLVKIP
ncbi:hypothetical protein NON20_14520 [Synechocystis sp. B12]|nr:hypothetical protein NON20_14520 [Synechocystis sp. B12]